MLKDVQQREITKQDNYISEGWSCPSPSILDRSGSRSSSSDQQVLLGTSAAKSQTHNPIRLLSVLLTYTMVLRVRELSHHYSNKWSKD